MDSKPKLAATMRGLSMVDYLEHLVSKDFENLLKRKGNSKWMQKTQ